ncbi:MAG: cyclic nucleotide-binding domain-containing protein [Spirochaetales bacterium]|nr:cyclic nucleotide-binding domain-containing protein [Spirochaetales bacterium]
MNKITFKNRMYKKGSIVWMERSKAMPYFFIVKSGQLKRFLRIMLDEDVTFLNSGDTFGLIACLTGHAYLDRLVAVKDTEVIMIDKKDIVPFLSGKPDIFIKIASDYSNRLRKINQKLFKLCSRSPYMDLPRYLLEIGNYFKQRNLLSHYLYALSKYVEYAADEGSRQQAVKLMESLKSEQNITIREPVRMGAHLIYQPGDIIFLEQEKGENFYFIEQGKVKISHIDREKEFVIAILQQNEFFGEMAILNQLKRNATAIAFSETKLLELSKDTFMNQLGAKILEKIFTSFARRIWYSYRRSINLSYKNPVTRLYDCLDFIIQSKEGRQKDQSYFFDISLTDLRVMTNTSEEPDNVIKDFLNDDNIRYNYGKLSINKIAKYYDTLKIYLTRERSM